MLGRKIHPDFENPIDNILIQLCDDWVPIFKKRNWTPNQITTLSNIMSLLGLLAMYTKSAYTFIVFSSLGYFLDCMDGHFARKYDQCSVLGDYYDHVSDWILISIFGWLHFQFFGHVYNFSTVSGIILITLTITLVGLMIKHMGCQELCHDCKPDHQSGSIGWLKSFACKEQIIWTRFFGVGTAFTYFYGLTFYFLLFD